MIIDTRRQIELLLAGEDPDVRRHAAEALASTSGLTSVAALASALRDSNKGVRDAASRALLGLEGGQVARAIVEYIADENIVTRNLAAELLGHIGAAAVPALLPYLQDRNQDVRKFAVDILGLIGPDVPTGPLLPLLHDGDANVVLSTVEALGNIGAKSAVPDLCELFEMREDVRAAAAEALGKIQDPATATFLISRLHEGLIGSGLDPVALFSVIEAIGAVGNAETLSVLRRHVPDVKGKTRSALLHAMVRVAERLGLAVPFEPAWKEALLEALRDDDAKIRTSAARALAYCDGADVTEAMIRALETDAETASLIMDTLARRPGVFGAAAAVLEEAGGSQPGGVIGLLARLVPDLIARVMRGEGSTPGEEELARAFGLVAERWPLADEEVRAEIVDVLFRLDGDRAVSFLDLIMNDPDPWLRMHVIEIIAAIADRRAPDFIARFLDDDDDMVREVAAETLRRRGYALQDEEG